jgi:hypothetical protein
MDNNSQQQVGITAETRSRRSGCFGQVAEMEGDTMDNFKAHLGARLGADTQKEKQLDDAEEHLRGLECMGGQGPFIVCSTRKCEIHLVLQRLITNFTASNLKESKHHTFFQKVTISICSSLFSCLSPSSLTHSLSLSLSLSHTHTLYVQGPAFVPNVATC